MHHVGLTVIIMRKNILYILFTFVISCKGGATEQIDESVIHDNNSTNIVKDEILDSKESTDVLEKVVDVVEDAKARVTMEVADITESSKEVKDPEPKEELIEKVEPEKADLSNVYNSILKKYVDVKGVVDYKGMLAQKEQLGSYLKFMKDNEPNDSRKKNARLVYWINLYNAATLNLILDNYPLKSIMDINGGKAWDLKIVEVGNKMLSLNQIENEIIRPEFKEPRIHFAVNCAAISCPILLNEIFTTAKLEQQLTSQTRLFLADAGKNKLTTGSLKLSNIFNWYKEDFEINGSLVEFIAKYTDIRIDKDPKIEYLEYEWNLNGN